MKTAEPVPDVYYWGVGREEEFHHPRVYHVICKLLIGTFDVISLAELCRLKVNIIEAYSSSNFVEYVLTPTNRLGTVGNGRCRMM